jgi:hypothetical protein
MTWWVAGAAVGGALISSYGAQSAAGTQADAANNSTALQAKIYEDTTKRNEPFVSGGTNALGALLERLGIGGNASSAQYGNLLKTVNPQDVQNDPGYQWAQQQGQQGIDRSLAARGMTNSGRALKAASQFNTGNATKFFNDAFNRNQSANQQQFNMLAQPVQWGQASVNNTAASGAAFGQAAGQNIVGAGDAQAANSIAQGNIWGNALNQGVSAYTRGQQNQNQINPATGMPNYALDPYGP